MSEGRMPSFFRLVCHGGQCCGIKHLYNFPYSQDTIVPAVGGRGGDILGARGQQLAVGKNFYKGKAPKETAIKRLDRVLEWCKENQRGGLIEVCLTQFYTNKWKDALIERGFKIVTTFKNSNTHSSITVYHKVNEFTSTW